MIELNTQHNKATYLGASAVFRFAPNSPYSKFSKQYGVDLRMLLAEKTKRFIQTETQKCVSTRLDFIWFDSEAEHLDAYPSTLEIGGYAITDGIQPKEMMKLKLYVHTMEKELKDLFRDWETCTLNMYTITGGKFMQMGNWRM